MPDGNIGTPAEKAGRSLSNKNVLENMAISAFYSFWISTVGLAAVPVLAYPPISIIWGNCKSDTILSSGQSSTSRHFYYINSDDIQVTIPLPAVIGLTFIFYTAVCFVPVNIRIFFISRKYRKRSGLERNNR